MNPLDLNGKIIWKKRYDYPPVHGSGCSPVIEGDLLLFSADGASSPALYALDKKTGGVRWKAARAAAATASCVASGRANLMLFATLVLSKNIS